MKTFAIIFIIFLIILALTVLVINIFLVRKTYGNGQSIDYLFLEPDDAQMYEDYEIDLNKYNEEVEP